MNSRCMEICCFRTSSLTRFTLLENIGNMHSWASGLKLAGFKDSCLSVQIHHFAFFPFDPFTMDICLSAQVKPVNLYTLLATLEFARSHLLLFLGWTRTTTSFHMGWTFRMPFFLTQQTSTSCFPASSSFLTVLLVLTFTSTPPSGRLRRTVGYVYINALQKGETYRGGLAPTKILE